MPPTRQTPSKRSSRSTSRPSPARVERVRAGMRQMFSGRSTVGTQSSPPDSPKTPRLALGLNNLSSTRLVIPYLTRTTTNPRPSSESTEPPSRTPPNSEPPVAAEPAVPAPVRQRPALHDIAVLSVQTRRDSSDGFVPIDPAEHHLAQLANEARRRRHKSTDISRRRTAKAKTKLRSKIVTCFVSGMVLITVLAAYLGLVLTPHDVSQEFKVLLILILLVAAIIFCHSLIRIAIVLLRPPKQRDLELQLPQMVSAGGYANPDSPIRVALARDEEAIGVQSEATKRPPPAYGLWRESVRVDPNRLFWQRNSTTSEISEDSRTDRPQTANRPPSYISEDGVHYVLEAQPRSIAPTVEVPLPPHPAERRPW